MLLCGGGVTFYLACWKIIADILPNRAGLSCAKIAGGKSGRQLYSIIQTPFSARKTPLNLLNSALFVQYFSARSSLRGADKRGRAAPSIQSFNLISVLPACP